MVVSGPPNSAITCKQAPHGLKHETGLLSLFSVEIAIACSRVKPAATPAQIATRSAQIVKPNDAFSTFTPANVTYSFSCGRRNTAVAPTRQPE